jgi:aldose 1-epimerase
MTSSTSRSTPGGDALHTEIVLSHGMQEAIVSPYGASLRGYYERAQPAREIATRYAGAALPRAGDTGPHHEDNIGHKVGGQGDVLIPFPGRVRGGTYSFDGHSYQMERNDQEGPNAIHGFLRTIPWNLLEQTDDGARFEVTLGAHHDGPPGYPFALRSQVDYRVGDEGLTCSFRVENIGESRAPVAAGFHPYFTVGTPRIDTNELHLPMRSTLQFGEGLVPTGGVVSTEGTPYDFRSPRVIGDTRLNHCFLNPDRDTDGKLRVRLRDPETGRRVTVWMDEAFNYVVVYSGDPMPPEHRRSALAIEPMTCGSDAFNHPEWGLAALAPGEILQGTWGVTAG